MVTVFFVVGILILSVWGQGRVVGGKRCNSKDRLVIRTYGFGGF